MKRTLIGLICFIPLQATLGAQTSSAATPPAESSPALAAAKELFALQLPRERWDQIKSLILRQLAQSTRAEHPDGGDPEPALRRVFDEMLSYEEILDIGAGALSRHLAASDIQHIVAFYRSPPGQKSLSAMPLVMSDAMQQSNALVQQRLPAILARLKQEAGKAPPSKQDQAPENGTGTPPRKP